jgi:hypothetical protein
MDMWNDEKGMQKHVKHSSQTPRTTFFNSPRKLFVFLILITALCAGVLTYLANTVPNFGIEDISIIGGTWLLICGVVIGTQHHMIDTKTPQLVISAAGIEGPRVGAMPIPWEDMKRISIVGSWFRFRIERGYFLAIAVHGNLARFAPLGITQVNRLGRLGFHLEGREIMVRFGELNGNAAAMESAIRQARPNVDLVVL